MERSNFWIAFVGVFIFFLITALIVVPRIWQYYKTKQIDKVGILSSAKVIEVTDTGNRFNYNPEVIIKLLVLPEGNLPFSTEVRVTLSMVSLQSLTPGRVIKVKYDPKKPEFVTILY